MSDGACRHENTVKVDNTAMVWDGPDPKPELLACLDCHAILRKTATE